MAARVGRDPNRRGAARAAFLALICATCLSLAADPEIPNWFALPPLLIAVGWTAAYLIALAPLPHRRIR